LVFKIRGDQIVVRKKPAGPVISLFARSQPSLSQADLDRMLVMSKKIVVVDDVTISGQVVDEGNRPMPGVNVVVKGSTMGTSTDVGGRYSLTVADGNAVLAFSLIGYQSQDVIVGTHSTLSITMQPDVSTPRERRRHGY